MNQKMLNKIFALVIAVLLIGCSTPKQKKNLKITLQKDLIIEDSDENEHQNFFFIRTLDVDRDGNIYVLDEKKVLKFDKSGKFLWVIDQKGQGPGEFQRIVDLSLSSDGSRVYIAEQNQRKIMIFSTAGKFIDEFKIKEGDPIHMAVDSKNFFYISFLFNTGDFLLNKYSPEGELINTFIDADKSEKDPQLRGSINHIFFCTDHEDNVVVTFQYRYSFLKYSPEGKLISRWTRELPFKPKKPKIESPQPGWRQVVGDLLTQDIAVDNNNNIFVIWGSQLTENGYRVEIFSPTGLYLGHFYSSITPLDELQYFHIDWQENLYIIDPLNEPKVFRFKMIIRE